MNRPNAAELLDAINFGKTLYVHTYTTVTPIDRKTIARFDRAGYPLLKDGKDGHLYMAQGRRYVDCHFATLILR
jgi:hypothetical protein